MKEKTWCPLSSRCGGCDYANLPYSIELKLKRDYLKKLFFYIDVPEVIPCRSVEHYRDKVQAVIGERNGRIVSGLYIKGTHHVIDLKDCRLEFEGASSILASVRSLMKSFSLAPYDEDRRTGDLRHVLLRHAHNRNEVMATLVFGSDRFRRKKEFAYALVQKHPEIKTVAWQLNDEKTSMVLSDKAIRILYGDDYIEDEICTLRFRITPSSFFQINRSQTEVLYETAMRMASLRGNERVLDAYSGTGTIALIASGKAGRVVAVEENGAAVQIAKENARLNGIENVDFVSADASLFCKETAKKGVKFDAAFLDPPRSGCDERFLSSLIKMGPEKIVYISCNPETQARDIRYLKNFGSYYVRRIQGVDMFPRTSHVETVVLLSQQKPDDTIEIDLDLDELDATAAETKATYEEIKAYVWEKHNMKVSSLYISQVKRKCGLEIGQNYNLSKSENPKVPKCPAEKEAAIMNALKHFQMI